MNIASLKDLSLYEIDNISELRVGSDADTPKGREILEGIRDAVVEAGEYGRWDVRPSKRGAVVHELADGLVPSYNASVIEEFKIIGWAWHVELGDAQALANLWDFGNHAYGLETALDATILGLYAAYHHGIRQLVEWLDDQDEDEDDEDDE